MRRTALWIGAALAGLVVAAGLTTAAAQLSNQRVGLSSEPLTAGDALAPTPTASPTRTPKPTPTRTPRPRRTATPTPARTAVPTVDDHGGDDTSGSGGDDSGGRGRGRGRGGDD